jgi:hypothetical protein
MEEFITTLSQFTSDKVTREQDNSNLLSEELRQLQDDLAQAEMDDDDTEIDFTQNEIVGVKEAIKESNDRVAYLQSITAGQQFPLYKRTIEELLSLMKNKVLRNEGDISANAKTIGGSCCSNWIEAHQNQEFI